MNVDQFNPRTFNRSLNEAILIPLVCRSNDISLKTTTLTQMQCYKLHLLIKTKINESTEVMMLE